MMKTDHMGKLVLVTHHLRRTDEGNGVTSAHRKVWVPAKYQPTPRVGWITGCRALNNGRIEWVGHDEGCIWVTEGTVPAYLVVFWPNLKPEPVPFEGLRFEVPEGMIPTPHRFGKPQWSERERAEQREQAKNTPRDARGRFT